LTFEKRQEEIRLPIKKAVFAALLAAAILSALPGVMYAASDKVGFIDAQLVLIAHPKYAESRKYLDDFITKKSDEAKAAAEKETNPTKRMEIIDFARGESGQEEVRVMNPITAQINEVIEKVAKTKGVTIVINKALIYFGGVDMTEDVVKGVKAIK
jgi:outer membrane protein